MMISTFLLVLLPFAGAVTDMEGALHKTLTDGSASVADVQAAWAATMGFRSETADGVVATGYQVHVRSIDPARLSDEIPAGAIIRQYVEVTGHGPEPLQLFLPKSPEGRPVTIYRRTEAGLFVEPLEEPVSVGGYWRIDVRWPGRFVVHEPQTEGEGKILFPEYPDSTPDPSRKWHWRVYRTAVSEAVGPVPLLLIHGAGTDRWDEFLHWVRFSSEAAEFRQHYQLWNFSHEMTGIDAPIGFDPNCPAFEESIVAYLNRFLQEAMKDGTPTAGTFYKFPADGPMAIITSSHGALKARAFMVNFPEFGDRVVAAVTLGGPHMGTPWATPEWLRFTASRLGLLTPTVGERIVEDAINTNYISLNAQSDLDMGWPNFDADGGYGIPYRKFSTWVHKNQVETRVLSPRDANITGARTRPDYDDNTFDPQELLSTYCGGMEHITPAIAGDLYMDKYFLHASYLYRGRGWLDMLLRAGDGVVSEGSNRFENSSLRLINVVMGFVPSATADWPLSPYRMGDGLVPLQSQLMLDGKETRPVFKTHKVLGWEVPVLPFTPDLEVIAEHTLADPERIRIWPGWSHLDTTTGRYNKETGHSELFTQVAVDLLSVLSEK